MRRTFIKLAGAGTLGLLTASLGGNVLAAASEPVKVVYHMVDGIDQATRGMGNIRNHLREAPETKIVVVAHGEGINFLLEGAKDRNGKPFDAAVAALASQGVEFRVCNNTLVARGIPASSLVLEAKVVPAGVVEVARLQAREGYVYLRP
ncbi:MAG: DsrE family protein [Herminiimonas sp.]|nr:DsrE family protein [Herminiimonas sp.]